MTTVNIDGIRLDFNNRGNASSIGSSTASLVLPSNSSGTFSYSVVDTEEGVASIEIADDALEIRIDDVNLSDLEGNNEIETFITSVNWSGGTTIILGLNIAPLNGGNDSDFYFVLSGPAPSVDTLDDWDAFDDSITSLSVPSGTYGPGRDISWTDFAEASSTEDDEFYGTSADDNLSGGIGDDYFTSSAGDDTYSGGRGFDQVNYRNDGAGVTVDLQAGTATDGFGDTDTLINIEAVRGSAFDDDITGDRGNNMIRGLAGDDDLDGGRGNDLVSYNRDARYGGTDGVTINLQRGYAIDGFGDRDTLTGFERAIGTDSKDKIIGSRRDDALEGLSGNDVLKGGRGDDELFGSGGKDKLEGGAGDDELTGGSRADQFIFKGNFGNDTITDFSTQGSAERINLARIEEIRSFNDLINNHISEDSDGNAVISDDDGNTITLEGLAIADLSANDFLL